MTPVSAGMHARSAYPHLQLWIVLTYLLERCQVVVGIGVGAGLVWSV